MDAKRVVGKYPQKVRVKAGEGIDGGSEGRNAFDKMLRSVVPRILDVSCISWKNQFPLALKH